MNKIKLSIVIPVYNNWHFTRACLNDLSRLSNEHEVIVVDNNSSDGTSDGMNAFFDLDSRSQPSFIYFKLDKNTGFAHACNYGYSKALGENVMFLNNDIRVQNNYETWTSEIITKASTHIVGPTGGFLDNNFNFIRETNSLIDTPFFYMSGWNLTASKEIFDKLILPECKGPFTEEFGIAYFEDTDLSYRARELGISFEVIHVPVVHFGKMTSNKLGTLSLYQPAKIKFIAKWKNRIYSK